MFQDLNRAIREEVVTLLFHAEVTPDEQRPSCSRQGPNGGGNGALATSTSRSPARRRSSRRAARRPRRPGSRAAAARSRHRSRRSRRSTARSRTSAGTTPAGAAPARSSRSATAPDAGPRRLTRRSRTTRSASSRSPRRTRPRSRVLGRRRHRPLHARPAGADRDFATGWLGRYEPAGATGRAGFAIRDGQDAAILGFAAFVHLDLDGAEGEIGYSSAGRARPRRRARGALDLLTRWGFDELGLERLELRIEPRSAVGRVARARRATA